MSEKSQPSAIIPTAYKGNVHLSKKDFYKELKLRGYHYNGDFQSVELAYGDGSYGKIKWFNNWVSFMDCMLQLSIVRNDSRNLALPVKLRSLRIFSTYHKNHFENNSEIEIHANSNRIVGGGIEIIDLKASHIQRRKPPGQPVLEKYQFIANFQAPRLTAYDISKCCSQLYLENFPTSKISIAQALTSPEDDLVFLKGLVQSVDDLPNIHGSYICVNMTKNENINPPDPNETTTETTTIKYVESVDELESSIDILLIDEENFYLNISSLAPRLSANSMLLIKARNQSAVEKITSQKEFTFIGFFSCSDSPFLILTLLKKSTGEQLANAKEEIFIKISQYDDQFQWIDSLKGAIGKHVVLVAENETHNGVLGLVNCLRKEPETSNIRCVIIDDMRAPDFDPNLPFYSHQLKLGLAINVYRQVI